MYVEGAVATTSILLRDGIDPSLARLPGTRAATWIGERRWARPGYAVLLVGLWPLALITGAITRYRRTRQTDQPDWPDSDRVTGMTA